jgi:hypothetical protein
VKKQSLALVLSLGVLGLVGCSDALDKEDVSKLSMNDAAIEACKAFVSLDVERISVFLENRDVAKLKATLANDTKRKKAEKLFNDSVCKVTKSRKSVVNTTYYTFEKFPRDLEIFKNKENGYTVKSFF